MTLDEPDILSPPHRPSIWHTIESTINVFFAFLVGFVIAVFGGNLAYLGRNEPEAKWFVPVSG